MAAEEMGVPENIIKSNFKRNTRACSFSGSLSSVTSSGKYLLAHFSIARAKVFKFAQSIQDFCHLFHDCKRIRA